MKLESIVTSLKMSKDLEKAGFVADTCFWWVCDDPTSGHFMCSGKYHYDPRFRVYTSSEVSQAFRSEPTFSTVVPAYDFQTLWKVLTDIYIEGHQFTLDWKNIVNLWSSRELSTIEDFGGEDLHLPDSVVEAILWCIKEGYITV